jgi:hypothetical protein
MANNVEEHTVTQSDLTVERPADWKAMERCAEHGRWRADSVTSRLAWLVESAPGRLWSGYHVSAVDDTKVHRTGGHVWGTCTFHGYTARCPNQATTVRAHNWVVLGVMLDYPDKSAWFLPISVRLYFRQSQLAAQPSAPGGIEPFHTKCELAVAQFREQARIVGGHHLGILDGGQALESVGRPVILPEDGSPRIDFPTRLRHDARLYALPPKERPQAKRGPKPKWGKRLAPPRQGGSIGRALAGWLRVRLRAAAKDSLEGGRLLVACSRP